MLLRVVDIKSTDQAPPAEIIEFGRVDVRRADSEWQVGRPMARLYRSLNGIPPETMAVHHITEMDMTPDTAVCTVDRLRRAVWSGDAPDGLVAHNPSFEQMFIAQDVTDVLPLGTAGATSFKTYVAESRHVTQVHTVIAEAAVFEAVKMRRALGDVSEVTTKNLWDRVAGDISTKLHKALGMDLANGTRRTREAATDTFIQGEHSIEVAKAARRKPGVEVRAQLRAEADRKAVCSQLGALEEALTRNGDAVTALGQEIESFLRTMRDQTAELARRGIEAAELRQARDAAAARPSFSPDPY